MDMPQVPDQVKPDELQPYRGRPAPAQALRAVFAGIGRILLAADRARASAAGPASQSPPAAQSPPASRSASAARSVPATHSAPATQSAPATHSAPATQSAPAAQARRVGKHERRPGPDSASVRWRPPDPTGNVRLLPAHERADRDADSQDTSGGSPAEHAHPQPQANNFLTGNVPVGASLVVHALPLSGYDTLSVASIRARLRGLDVSKLQALLVYEHKHAARPEVLAMIQRRIAKLESGG